MCSPGCLGTATDLSSAVHALHVGREPQSCAWRSETWESKNPFYLFVVLFFIIFIWYLTWMDTQSRCSLRMSLTSWICPAHSFESWQSHYYHNFASEVPRHHGGLCRYCRSLVDHSSPPSPVWDRVRISFTWDTDSNKLEIMTQFSASLTWGQNIMTASALPGPALLATEAEVTANPVHVHLAN